MIRGRAHGRAASVRSRSPTNDGGAVRRFGVQLLLTLLALSTAAGVSRGSQDMTRTQVKRYDAGTAVGVKVSIPEPRSACRKAHSPATLVLRGGGDVLRAHTSTLCADGYWVRRGRAPGIQFLYRSNFWRSNGRIGSTFLLAPSFGTAKRQYRFTLRTRDRAVKGRLYVHHVAADEEQIFEGTDAFVNYCINQGKEIRSENGRLYCVRITGERGSVKLRLL